MAVPYEIVEHIATLDEGGPYTRELNLISWNGSEANLDIRKWDRRTEEPRPLKGIVLTEEEAGKLAKALRKYLSEKEEGNGTAD
jgi:hypothetical protein